MLESSLSVTLLSAILTLVRFLKKQFEKSYATNEEKPPSTCLKLIFQHFSTSCPSKFPALDTPRIWSLNKTSSQCMAKDSSEKRSHACCFTSAPSHITKKNETNGGRNLNYGSAMAKRRRRSEIDWW